MSPKSKIDEKQDGEPIENLKALKIVKHLPKNEEQLLLKEAELKVKMQDSRAAEKKALKASLKLKE